VLAKVCAKFSWARIRIRANQFEKSDPDLDPTFQILSGSATLIVLIERISPLDSFEDIV
jgi:hypothetical protein